MDNTIVNKFIFNSDVASALTKTLVSQAVWSAGVFVVIASLLRLPDRVAIPNLLGLSVTLLLAPHLLVNRQRAALPERAHSRSRRFEFAVLAAAIVVLVGPIAALRSPAQLSRTNAKSQARLQRQLQLLDSVAPGARFVAFGAAVNLEAVDPLDADAGFRAPLVLETGWATFSPSYEERKLQMGLQGDLLANVASGEKIFLVASPASIPVLRRVYLRRLGWTVTASELADLDNGVRVWLVRRSDGDVEPMVAGW